MRRSGAMNYAPPNEADCLMAALPKGQAAQVRAATARKAEHEAVGQSVPLSCERRY